MSKNLHQNPPLATSSLRRSGRKRVGAKTYTLAINNIVYNFAVIQNIDAARYLTYVVPIYIGTCVAVFVVELTTAAHFGIDHSTLNSKLVSSFQSASKL